MPRSNHLLASRLGWQGRPYPAVGRPTTRAMAYLSRSGVDGEWYEIDGDAGSLETLYDSGDYLDLPHPPPPLPRRSLQYRQGHRGAHCPDGRYRLVHQEPRVLGRHHPPQTFLLPEDFSIPDGEVYDEDYRMSEVFHDPMLHGYHTTTDRYPASDRAPQPTPRASRRYVADSDRDHQAQEGPRAIRGYIATNRASYASLPTRHPHLLNHSVDIAAEPKGGSDLRFDSTLSSSAYTNWSAVGVSPPTGQSNLRVDCADPPRRTFSRPGGYASTLDPPSDSSGDDDVGDDDGETGNHPGNFRTLKGPRRSPRSFSSRGSKGDNVLLHTTSDYWGGGDVPDNDLLLCNHSFSARDAEGVLVGFSSSFPDIRSVPLLIMIPRSGKSISDDYLKRTPTLPSLFKQLSTLYVIIPSQYQIGVAKTLAVPHGQVPLVELVPSLIEYSADKASQHLTVHFVRCQENFADSNLCIRNDVVNVALPWNEISKCLQRIPRSTKEDATRQKVKVDIGFAGTKCVGRNARCDLGLAAPRMLVASRDCQESTAFFSKTRLIDRALEGCRAMKGASPSPSRVKRWGSKLGSQNSKEAARLHETEWSPVEASLCAIHKDSQNGSLSQVTFCNRVFESDGGRWKRQGAVMYHRKSIDDYEVRRADHGPYLKAVKSTVLAELKERMVQSADSIRRTDRIEIAEGLHALRIRCNCEVESYYQPFVASLVRLAEKFDLTELQLLSCLLAMAQSLCSASYALAATEIAIAHSNQVRGDLGFELLRIIKNLDKAKPKPVKLVLRFPKYMSFDYDNEREWLRRVRTCHRGILEVREKTAKLVQTDYNRLNRLIMANLEGVAELRSNHLMGLCAIIGLIPLPMFGMVDGGAKKAILLLKKMFGSNVPGSAKTHENIHHLLEEVTGRKVTRRYTENVLCKSGRVLCGSDKTYWDLVDPRFPLISVVGGKVKLVKKGQDDLIVNAIFELNEDGIMVPAFGFELRKRKKRTWMRSMLR